MMMIDAGTYSSCSRTLLAEARALETAIGTEPLFERDVVHDPPARQTRRQGLAAMAFDRRFRRCRRHGFGGGFEFRRRLGSGRFDDLLREEQELVGVEFLGLPAVEPTEELFELMLEIER